MGRNLSLGLTNCIRPLQLLVVEQVNYLMIWLPRFPPEEIVPERSQSLPSAKPNVGKSSLINFIGWKRNMVTGIAGTITIGSNPFRNTINSAKDLCWWTPESAKRPGVRGPKVLLVMRAIKSIEEAEVCFLVIDATTRPWNAGHGTILTDY